MFYRKAESQSQIEIIDTLKEYESFIMLKIRIAHIWYILYRILSSSILQAKWQQSMLEINEAREEDGDGLDSLPYSINQSLYENIVEPLVQPVMYTSLAIHIVFNLISWRYSRLTNLIFWCEVIHLLLCAMVPINYGVFQSFIVGMDMIALMALLNNSFNVNIVVVTLQYFVMVFVQRPIVFDKNNSMEDSVEFICYLFLTVFVCTSIELVQRLMLTYHRKLNFASTRKEYILDKSR